MRAEKLSLLIFWAGLMGLWAMSVRGGWAEQAYRRAGERSFTWYWLRLFGIPVNERNGVRFVKGVSLLGVLLLTMMVLLGLVWGE